MTRLFSFTPLLVLTLCALMRGCSYPDDYVEFRKLPPDQQTAQFKQLPIDRQIDYYFYDQSHEPPYMGFGKLIASQGESVLPDLLRRLKAEPAEHRQNDLIWVIETMHTEFQPLDKNNEVIETVEKVVNQMKDPAWQASSRKSLEVIRSRPGTPAPPPRIFRDPNSSPTPPGG